MAAITAQSIKQLRDKTNAGMMDCKAALTEAGGDLEAAETLLRKKGIAAAGKKASREVKEGIIDAYIGSEERVGALVEINCETDFVAKNENFTSFSAAVAEHAAKHGAGIDSVEGLLATSFGDATLEESIKAKIAELGENLVLKRFSRFAIPEGTEGGIGKYIHLAGKVGVLVEVACEKADSAKSDAFHGVVKDITLQIAAAHPLCVSREEVDPALVATEKEVFAEQVKGKPDNIVEKIVAGKLDKYYSTVALLEQGYIKDPDTTIAELLAATGKDLDDNLVVRRFTRYAVGEVV
ncbi:translation elongation factor Ts [soil metagenome]